MWNPDQEEEAPADYRLELIKALHESEEVRTYYGLKKNEDGSFEVINLEKIKAFPEDVKHILREFLKANRRVEAAKPPPPPAVGAKITPELRAQLDGLYSHIDHLKAMAPRNRPLRRSQRS